MIRDGVFNEQTGKLEDQLIMSRSTVEYMRDNWEDWRPSTVLIRL